MVLVAGVPAARTCGRGCGSAGAAGCPVAPNPAALPSAAALRGMNKLLATLGARPTGSAAQNAYIAWIRRELRAIPGVKLGQLDFPINRWTETAATLELRSGRPRDDAADRRRGPLLPPHLAPRRHGAAGLRSPTLRRSPPPTPRARSSCARRRPGARRSTTSCSRSSAGPPMTPITRSIRRATSSATSSPTTTACPICATRPRPARPGSCSSRTSRAARSSATTSPTRARGGGCRGCSWAPTRASGSPTRSLRGQAVGDGSSCAPTTRRS